MLSEMRIFWVDASILIELIDFLSVITRKQILKKSVKTRRK